MTVTCSCARRYPSPMPDHENHDGEPQQMSCLVCSRSIMVPYDHRYPVFNLQTQRLEIPTPVATVPARPPAFRLTFKRGTLTLWRVVPGADRAAQQQFLLDAA